MVAMPNLPTLALPIIAAPMAGGPSTPELVAAVAAIGGSGFLAAGYRTAGQMHDQIKSTRALTDAPFGVNLFVPNDDPVDDSAIGDYRQALAATAAEYGPTDLALPTADSPDTDDWDAKIAVLQSDPAPMVSFTFGLPGADVVRSLQTVGSCVIATVTSVDEAEAARSVGYDALVVQGPEAGGHRGTHSTLTEPGALALTELLPAVAQAVDLPLIAAGGLTDHAAITAALEHAVAVQLGTTFLLADEAGTSATHRRALQDPAFTTTTVTRSFTGRPARSLHNKFIDRFGACAPAAYPAVHHLTGPLRRAAAEAGDAQFVHLWAGTGWRDIRSGKVATIVADLWP